MKVLRVLDRRDYASGLPEVTRTAARAVIYDAEGRLALVKSVAGKYYKLPGGGVKDGETLQRALCREVREETGLEIDPNSIEEIGIITERRKGLHEDALFVHNSCIFKAKLREGWGVTEFTQREREPGWMPVFENIHKAYHVNRKQFLCSGDTFLEREAYILGLLCGEITMQ